MHIAAARLHIISGIRPHLKPQWIQYGGVTLLHMQV
jgi:hypothetical protein